MDSADVFYLGVTPLNIVLSLSLIVLGVWFSRKIFEDIADELQNKLTTSLSRFFDGANRQPLYEVFYGLHHSSTESWVAWITAQSEKKQERAFRRLSQYLQEPPKELGSITKEVVKAVSLFKHEDSYQVLSQLLQNTREQWGKYKALSQFYEDAAIAIVELNHVDAVKFLRVEMNLVKNIVDSEKLKLSIITALSKSPNQDLINKIFLDIMIDPLHGKNIKTRIISEISKIGDKSFLEFLKMVIKSIISQKETKDYVTFDLCFEELLEFAGIKDDDELFEILLIASQDKDYGNSAVKILASKLKNPTFYINQELLFNIVKFSDANVFDDLRIALELRYYFNEEEKSIIDSYKAINKIAGNNQYPKEEILTTIAKETIKLPDILKDSYKRLEDVLNKKTNSRGLHLLTGDSEIEKFYYAKIWAKQYEKELIYLDVEKLLLSPDKLDEAEMYISKKKPCLVYFKNLINLLHNYKNPENSRAQKIMSLIEKFQNDSRITMLGTISLDAMDIRDDLPTIQKIISEDLSEIIISKINFGELTAKQKQKIYSYFELKLKDDREVAIDGLEEFFDATEKMTNLTFTCYILEYMSLSLLAMGKLITHELYTNLLKRKETENKLINHA